MKCLLIFHDVKEEGRKGT